MRICLIASSRHPIREPFAGGLESLTHDLAVGLSGRGHEVTLFAGPGSDPGIASRVLPLATHEPSEAACADRNAPSREWMIEHHAYLSLMLELASGRAGRFDLVHNNSLHYLPVAMAPALPMPLVTTLHTPALPWVESAIATSPFPARFTAVSEWTSQAWRHVVASTVVHNGVDPAVWRPGPGGGPVVWSGRLVPEKAPHEAIDACRSAGLPLVLAGPAHDGRYFADEIAPRLGPEVEYAGHLDRPALARLLAGARAAVVTPAWDEPYGLVAAEAMACGTPVAAYDRGAMREVIGEEGGLVVPAGDVVGLGRALEAVQHLERRRVRRHAVRHCSLSRMLDDYESVYATMLDDVAGRAVHPPTMEPA